MHHSHKRELFAFFLLIILSIVFIIIGSISNQEKKTTKSKASENGNLLRDNMINRSLTDGATQEVQYFDQGTYKLSGTITSQTRSDSAYTGFAVIQADEWDYSGSAPLFVRSLPADNNPFTIPQGHRVAVILRVLNTGATFSNVKLEGLTSALPVFNSSFESDLTNWAFWNPTSSRVDPDTSEKHDGAKSMRIQLGTGVAYGGHGGCINQTAATGNAAMNNPALWREKPIKFSYWYKTLTGVSTSLKVNLTKQDGSRNSYWIPGVLDGASSTTWIKAEKEITVPATLDGQNVTAIDLDLCASSPENGGSVGENGRAWFDQIEATTGVNLLRDNMINRSLTDGATQEVQYFDQGTYKLSGTITSQTRSDSAYTGFAVIQADEWDYSGSAPLFVRSLPADNNPFTIPQGHRVAVILRVLNTGATFSNVKLEAVTQSQPPAPQPPTGGKLSFNSNISSYRKGRPIDLDVYLDTGNNQVKAASITSSYRDIESSITFQDLTTLNNNFIINTASGFTSSTNIDTGNKTINVNLNASTAVQGSSIKLGTVKLKVKNDAVERNAVTFNFDSSSRVFDVNNANILSGTQPFTITISSSGICTQVIAFAVNPSNSNDCREFPTPCDVPQGWQTVNTCPAVSPSASPSVSPSVSPNPSISPSISPSVSPNPSVPPSGGSAPVTLNLKLKFQGVNRVPNAPFNTMSVKVKLAGTNLPNPTNPQTGTFTASLESGVVVWNGSVTFPGILPGAGYQLLIKGSKHMQRKICDVAPSETALGLYSCVNTNSGVPLQQGNNTFNVTGITLQAGDLNQDGRTNSADITMVTNNLTKSDAAALTASDVNFDGVVNTQDAALVIESLSTRNDEQ